MMHGSCGLPSDCQDWICRACDPVAVRKLIRRSLNYEVRMESKRFDAVGSSVDDIDMYVDDAILDVMAGVHNDMFQ